MGEFARMALGTDGARNRVRRYFDAWERAAVKGKVPAAADLEPGQEPDIDWNQLPEWRTVFADPSGLTGGGATGALNLAVHLGHYGDRLKKAHKRLLHFVEKDLPGKRPGKNVRETAGRYADCLEAEARVLRRIADGETAIDTAEVRDALALSRFFTTAR